MRLHFLRGCGLIVALFLGTLVGISSIPSAHADTNAWATPFPDYCNGLASCLSPGTSPWLGGADTGGDRNTSGLRVTIFFSSAVTSSIQADNDLGAGIAAAVLCSGSSDCGAGCPNVFTNCPRNSEDYVFYGFVDVSHSGRVRFVSSGWHDFPGGNDVVKWNRRLELLPYNLNVCPLPRAQFFLHSTRFGPYGSNVQDR